jgi:hypothetical protein
MANRALLAKVARATTQRRELGNAEYLKPVYISAPKITSSELAVLCAGVKVTRLTKSRTVTKKLIYGREVITSEREVSSAQYARGARKAKGAGTCERRLWIGKPPRI